MNRPKGNRGGSGKKATPKAGPTKAARTDKAAAKPVKKASGQPAKAGPKAKSGATKGAGKSAVTRRGAAGSRGSAKGLGAKAGSVKASAAKGGSAKGASGKARAALKPVAEADAIAGAAAGAATLEPSPLKTRRAKPAAVVGEAGAAGAESAPALSPEMAARARERAAAQERARAFAIAAARSLMDDRCEDVRALDVRGLSSLCDYLVIATGTSDRQMVGAGEGVVRLGAAGQFRLMRRELDERSTWLLLDFIDVVVHIFEPNTRAYYDLEMKWGDAPRLEVERPARNGPGEGAPARPPRTRIVVAGEAPGDGAEPGGAGVEAGA